MVGTPTEASPGGSSNQPNMLGAGAARRDAKLMESAKLKMEDWSWGAPLEPLECSVDPSMDSSYDPSLETSSGSSLGSTVESPLEGNSPFVEVPILRDNAAFYLEIEGKPMAQQAPFNAFGPLTHRAMSTLWTLLGREVHDPHLWLANYLAGSKVDKHGRSLNLRAFTKVYLKHYKEEHGVTRCLTSKERKAIAWRLRKQLWGLVKPGW